MRECIVCHEAEAVSAPVDYNHPAVLLRGLCRGCGRALTRYLRASKEPDLVMWAAKRAYAAGHRKGHAAGVLYQRRKVQVFRKKAGCQKFGKPRKRHPGAAPKRRRIR
ncbi:MAG: hypothetical protein KJ648_07630 [Candidatus Omnitrophica bacterium]|nr:hypothetical protein [Candidatus Omnitrophota bacterium]